MNDDFGKLRLKFTIITLFVDSVKAYLESSMMWKAQEKGIVEVEYVNLREFGLGPHRSVDDTPYGGGDGMLLRCEPVFAAVEWVRGLEGKRGGEGAEGEVRAGSRNGVAGSGTGATPEVIMPTPVGRMWNQELAREMAGVSGGRHAGENARVSAGGNMGLSVSEKFRNYKHYIIICPHYEGYDERILSIVDHKISLGRYVLTGGELPALVMIDSMVRLLPGVLGGEKSAEIESFSEGDNLEYPQYTRPAEFRGMRVPEVLLSGHHGKVEEWRRGHEGRVG